MNIIIPMSGAGQRFVDEGYLYPKPFLQFHGKTMIENVLENIGYNNQFILIMRKEHQLKFQHIIDNINKVVSTPVIVLTVDTLTQGAAETCLLAKNSINADEPLMIANCDQMFLWNQTDFEEKTKNSLDGYIFTFFVERNPLGYSYAEVDDNGLVIRTAEKEKISDYATTGIYVWAKAQYFFDAAESMIAKNLRVNNEFYVCPTFNENIAAGQKIGIWPIEKHYPIGTPSDFDLYLQLERNGLKNA